MYGSDGSSRDLPGYATDVKRLEGMLPTLGFRLLPTYWNKNADEVRKLLRHVQRGFQKVHTNKKCSLCKFSKLAQIECVPYTNRMCSLYMFSTFSAGSTR